MYQIHLQVASIILILAYSIHKLKRSLFFERHNKSEASRLWLRFLDAHPDPIVIFSDKRGLIFQNQDCRSIFHTGLEDQNGEPNADASMLTHSEELLMSLQVQVYSS